MRARAREALYDVRKQGGQLLKRTYKPLWKYGFNAPALRQHRKEPPRLGDEARRIVKALERDGVGVSSLEALTGDPQLLERLQTLAHDLERRNQRLIAQQRQRLDAGVRNGVWDKPFVVHLLDRSRPMVHPDGLLAGVGLHAQLRGIADSYFGLRTRIADVNFWRSLASTQRPQSSQLWHRDLAHDLYVLKMFLYLEDVDEGTGPLTYLMGTHPKGDQRRLRLPAHHDGQTLRSTADAPAMAGVADRVCSMTGPAGTVIFADTLGYHRGGWARTNPRLLLQVLYASRAAAPTRLLGVPHGVQPRDWDGDLAYEAA